MIKPRTIIVSVGVGFALSFIVGLVAGVSFGIILLRALIFAVLFGVLSFGVGLVSQRFLLDSLDLDGGAEVSGGGRQGSIVDLSVGDEPFIEDENGPEFYVRKEIVSHKASGHEGSSEENHVPFGAASRVREGVGSVAGQDSGQDQFRPISLGASAGDVGAEGAVPAVAKEATADSEDVLPEIGDIAMIPSGSGDDFSSGGMDFSIGNGMETSQGRSNSSVLADSNTIAQAIRTVLARDS